jgi:hypothetical protein
MTTRPQAAHAMRVILTTIADADVRPPGCPSALAPGRRPLQPIRMKLSINSGCQRNGFMLLVQALT